VSAAVIAVQLVCSRSPSRLQIINSTIRNVSVYVAMACDPPAAYARFNRRFAEA